MAKAIIMPKFGFTQEESTIAIWLRQPGEVVEKGDPICEVTTDKVNMEVEAPESGVLGGVRYPAGATVPVTEVIAYILAEGEQPPAGAAPAVAAAVPAAEAAPAAAPSSGAGAVTPVARRMAAAEGVEIASVPGSGPGGKVTRRDVADYLAARPAVPGKVRATPAARRVARQQGLDLAAVAGSGPRGRVQEVDALAVAQAVPVPAPLAAPSGQPVIIPLEGMRRTIADRMQASYQDAPHVLFTHDIDMTRAISFREYANARLPEGQPRISMTALIVKAVAWTLRQHPLFNSYLLGDEIHMLPDVNVGVAVALDPGLIVPVVREADRKGLVQIGAEVADLSARARSNHLRPGDVTDGTFTVSNLGMYGIDFFTAIINPPQVGILAVARTAKRFVPGEHDEPVVKPMMTVTLSADHRVIDGAQCAQFIATLRDALEEPSTILL